ncbi:MalY/PatB family protein [Chryseobacterium caseinilyticum]|uniref:cysteine-S-conjugate beta-lyase n=1 Tax=Chryseobacterium caseinilyticum TaxID=2771428 RepID=A0ABR8Z8F4_9FLAO|nr:MalY/PatB family protein [Chryseobacterium caseinilyticum]MBD8081525.1 pyridoxal phosphate-dependent aminotransferase [Chryseobacterium caseinilyticum]
MKYNFDEIIERRKTNSVKWDFFADDILPMWVADMDFKIAPEIQKVITDKAISGMMGYQFLSEEFKISTISWLQKHHDFTVSADQILPVPGMLLGISAIIRTFLGMDEKIILQPPVYDHFFETVKNSGAETVYNDLIYQNNSYSMDFDDLELTTSDPLTRFLLFCNPHNPVGKVWTEDDLRKIAEICSRNNVIVISDEIHSDLVFEDLKHIPFAKIAADYDLISFTLGSPCKTFNLSGLSAAYIISDQKDHLEEVRKTLQQQETEWINPFSAVAFTAAYQHGESWMHNVKKYISDNYHFAKTYIGEKIPQIKPMQTEATYLMWLDCKNLNLKSEILEEKLISEAKLKLNAGNRYGSAGEGFMRMNIACPREILTEGLHRLENFVNSYN